METSDSTASASSASFAALLKRHRLAAGLTQEELAARAKASPRGVSDLERGKRTKPHLPTVRALAEALALSESDRAAFLAAAQGNAPQPRTPAPLETPLPSGAPAESLPHLSPHPPTGTVTFLFTDIEGSTRLLQQLGASRYADALHLHGRLLRAAFQAHGGHEIDTQGDSFFVAFPAVLDALAATAEATRALAASSWPQDTPLRARMGLHVGAPRLVGDRYIGLDVHRAARIAAAGHGGQILLSAAAAELARHDLPDGVVLRDVGIHRLKDLQQPEQIYQAVLADLPADFPPLKTLNDVAAGPPLQPELPPGGFLGAEPEERMVAREAEVERLDAALDAVVAGSARLVLLAGEPGVGKTRLAQEVMLAARARGFMVATGRCYEPQQMVPYYPFLEALHHAYLQVPPALQREVPSRWPLLPRLLPDRVERSHGDERFGSSGEDDQQRLFWQVTGFLQALAVERPLALVLDDLHWADGASLALLQHLARHTRAHRVFLLGTYRDVEVNRRHPLEGALRDLVREQLLERLAVRRLTAEGTAALIRATLDTETVSPELTQLLYQRAEGNPFFTRELLRALLDQGVISPDGAGAPGKGDADELTVPESVRSVIGQRLARLAEETQAQLLEASVLGQTFAFTDLCAMSRRDEPEVERALDEAVAAGMIWEVKAESSAARQADYSFSHALLQQAVAAELSARHRRRLHQAAGEALERQPEQERTRRCAELAWHFLEADAPSHALPYVLEAGDQALAVYAFTEAERRFATAAELAQQLGDEEAQLRASEQLGRALMYLGKEAQAFTVLQSAAADAERRGDLSWQVRLLTLLVEVTNEGDAKVRGVARLQRLIEACRAYGPSPDLAQLYLGLAKVYLGMHQRAAGLDAAEQALHVAQAVDDAWLAAEARLWRGEYLGTLGRFEEAADDVAAALLVLEGASDVASRDARTFAHRIMGIVLTYLGQWGDAQAHLEGALALHEKMGYPPGIASGCEFLAEVAWLRGDWERARDLLTRARQVLAQLGDEWKSRLHSAYPLRMEADLYLAQGDVEAAQRCGELVLPITKEAGTIAWRWHAFRLLAELDLQQGHPAEALERLQALDPVDLMAMDVNQRLVLLLRCHLDLGAVDAADEAVSSAIVGVREQHDRCNLVDVLCAGAEARMQQGRWEETDAALEESLVMARQMGYPYAEAKALSIAGDSWMARHQPEQARVQYTAALTILRRLGERAYATRIEHRVAALGIPPADA
jgi:class 3 adenylate cyclase